MRKAGAMPHALTAAATPCIIEAGKCMPFPLSRAGIHRESNFQGVMKRWKSSLPERHERRPLPAVLMFQALLCFRHMNKVLWPEFTELAKLLNSYLDEATRDIISRAVHGDLSEARETPGLPGV
jgi:hypothetical protein